LAVNDLKGEEVGIIGTGCGGGGGGGEVLEALEGVLMDDDKGESDMRRSFCKLLPLTGEVIFCKGVKGVGAIN
jgi:hypothetical protein